MFTESSTLSCTMKTLFTSFHDAAWSCTISHQLKNKQTNKQTNKIPTTKTRNKKHNTQKLQVHIVYFQSRLRY